MLILVLIAGVAQADTLRVCVYNSLNFHGNADRARMLNFRTTYSAMRPDVVVMGELLSATALTTLRDSVFRSLDSDWEIAPFHDGPDTDDGLIYRSSKVTFISQRAISGGTRDINEYVIQPVGLDSTQRIRLYGAHLKASTGSDNVERRRQECALLRTQLELLPANSMFMMMGDFNLYTSEEPAYQLLLSASPSQNGQLYDPIDRPGAWNNNSQFSDIHTQSTRTTDLGDGGSTGGMDDRFDFILVSRALMDTVGSYVIPSSYKAYGNDGRHFNQDINDGNNTAVPAAVANALHSGSDHLPVVADFIIRPVTSSAVDPINTPSEFRILNCYPNPFNSTLTVELSTLGKKASLEIYDILGRSIFHQEYESGSAPHTTLNIDFSQYGTGSYFVRLQSASSTEIQKIMLVR
jgi:endonuclease/exonuclease/phosphatase family metal-dependent hydrolase